MARSQCWLAVVSCLMCLFTSATERLHELFLWPHTTVSRPISTRCNSKFRSLQLSNKKRGHGSEDSTHIILHNVNFSASLSSVALLLHLMVKIRNYNNCIYNQQVLIKLVWPHAYFIMFFFMSHDEQSTEKLIIILLIITSQNSD